MEENSTILIVDDERIGRDTLEALLVGQNYDLAFASDGAEALTRAAELTPDLILLDVMMPGMDGFEVCQRLRADPLLADVPIIMVTALDDRDSRLRGIEAGADDFVSKPFDRVELRARVRTITRLNRYRQLLLTDRQLESNIAQLSALYDISSALNSTIDIDVLSKSIIQKAKELLNVEGASIILWDQQRDELYLPIVTVEEEEIESRLKQIHLPTDCGIAGWVFREGKPALVPDVSVDDRFYKQIDENTGFTTTSILCVPLRGKEGILGILEVVNKKKGGFTEGDQHLLEAMADNVAVFIERESFYRDLQEAEAVLRHQNAELRQTVEALQIEIAERKQVEEALGKAYAELEEMQQQLIQSEKLAALGRFSSGVAHEVKNPLAIVLSGMEFLEMKLPNANTDTRKAMEKIKKATLRANDVLKNLLKFGRPSEPKLERVKPDDLINDALSFFEYRAPLRNIEIETQFPEEEIYVEVDKLQVQQILFNLLMNSVEAMPDGGEIKIETYKTALSEGQPCCVIEIVDGGEGMIVRGQVLDYLYQR
jgi:DNA-binding response OmpR family regulator/nitrogen-specific signal transduction histidine kinase